MLSAKISEFLSCENVKTLIITLELMILCYGQCLRCATAHILLQTGYFMNKNCLE